MINQSTKIFGTILGSFVIALPLTTAKSSAIPSVPNRGVNPCPSIYYEEPYNSKLIVPQSCQPNAATQKWLEQGYAPYPQFLIPNQENFIPSVGGMTPFPLQSYQPENTNNNEIISTIEPVAGKVDVKLKNNTNAIIAYQAIAHTKTRYLLGGEEIVLQDIPTPTSITMVREDGGFLKIEPQSTSSEKILTLSLDESQKNNDYQGILRIKSNGQVLLN
ncbi:MAG: hypothetical protein QNJ51_27250 [Calothrix sp. MO_167.B12]|nr:hypothetical protein [Calothrix sp. MO_167.B12]